MGYTSALRDRQVDKVTAPLHAVNGHQAVIVAVKVLHHGVSHIERESSAGRMRHFSAYALIVYLWAVGQHRIQTGAGGRGQILYGFHEIGIGIAELRQCGIVLGCHVTAYFVGYFFQQIVRKYAAVVGCVDGGKRRHIVGRPAYGNRITAVQSALGMGDDVDFLAACFLHNLLNSPGQFLSASLDRCGGLLVAVEDSCTVLLEFGGNPPPVVEEAEVAEEHAVDEKNRVACPTFLIPGTYLIQKILFILLDYLVTRYTDDLAQRIDLCNGNPAADDTDHAPLHAKLHGGQIDTYDAVPE